MTNSKVGLTVVETAGPVVRADCSHVRRPTGSPGQIACLAREVGKVSGIRYPLINGVAVVSPSAGIDVTTAEQLRTDLLEADRHGHATVVVDLTRTRFCDSAGLNVLAEAHQQALAEGGGLRLVIPVGGALAHLLFLTGLDCFIPSFGSLEGALASGCPRPSPEPRSFARQPGHPAEGGVC